MTKRAKAYRSAKSGEYVPKAEAKRHPDTTVGETRTAVRKPKRKRDKRKRTAR